MGIESLALMLLGSAIGAPPEPIAIKERAIAIPYNLAVAPAEVSEVVLYVSIDQGKVWSKAAVIKPTEKQFTYQAPTDGQYWFNVAVVYRNGAQVPADVSQSPPQQRVVFDTQKPAIRLNLAERHGDEATVVWEIHDANPDLATLKVEYRPADATAGGLWYGVPVNPGLAGQSQFHITTPSPITVRLSMQDTAGNLGWVEKNLAVNVANNAAPASPPAITQTQATNSAPPLPSAPVPAPAPVMPLEPPAAPAAAPVQPPLTPPGPAPLTPAPLTPAPLTPPMAPPAESGSGMVPLASSSSRDMGVRPVTNTCAAPSTSNFRPDAPELFTTNEPQVTVDYEIERVGPSGVSKVEVYLSQDDGRSWMRWQDTTPTATGRTDPASASKLPVALRLPEREGTFGFRMVPFSGAHISSGPPQAGDAPEVRIQVDRTTPVVELYKPEADQNQTQSLTLVWKATDANLLPSPIHIYWAEQPNGDWRPINTDGAALANTGRYQWQLPTGLPLKVYLKIVATDAAGNSGEAVTAQPVVVDLHKPVGRVRGIVDSKRRN